jgi:predicted nuclease with TOPRIM domain
MNSKNIIIIILVVFVAGLLYFREDGSIYKDKIDKLQTENTLLKTENDSLDVYNVCLEKEIGLINDTLVLKDSVLVLKDNKIIKLQNKRNEISNRVNTMDGNGVADSFTEYLQRRGENGN